MSDLDSDYAPLRADGRLPVALSARVVRQAYEASGHGAAHVLKLAKRPRSAGAVAEQLRRALDSAAVRDRLAKAGHGLHNALYHYYRKSAVGKQVFAPALEYREEKLFLAPTSFDDQLNARYQGSVLETLGPDDAIVAHLALAFSLLQPDDAGAIVGSLLRYGGGFRSFFHVAQGDAQGASAVSVRPAFIVAAAYASTVARGSTLDQSVEQGGVSKTTKADEAAPASTQASGEHQSLLSRLRARADRVSEIAARMNQASEYLEIARIAALADGAFRSLQAELSSISREHDLSIPEPVQLQLATVDGIERWLIEVQAALGQLLERRRVAVEKRRAALREEFLAVDLAVPSDLDDVATFEGLESIGQREATRLAEARLRCAVLRGDIVHLQPEIPPHRRVQIYAEALMADSGAGRVILTRFQGDPEACFADPRVAADAMARILMGWLIEETPIPPGVWELIASLDRPLLLRRLGGELGDGIELNRPDSAQIGELIEVLGGDVESLNPSLAKCLIRERIRRLPPAQRIRELAELALLVSDNTDVVSDLMIALAGSDRGDLTWLLADAHARVNGPCSLPKIVRPALLFHLAQSSVSLEQRAPTIETLVDGDSWIDGDLDALTIALFGAARVGTGPAILYRNVREIEALRGVRPALFDLWLEPVLNSRTPRCCDPLVLAAWRHHHGIAGEWGRELQKRTCYQGWRYAEEYQRLARWGLEELVGKMNRDLAFNWSTGETMMQRIEKDSDLPAIENPARSLLVAYLERQLERAREINRALNEFDTSLDVLATHSSPPFSVNLARERDIASSRAVTVVYDFVLEQIKCAQMPG